MYIDNERFRCITDSDKGIKLSWIGNKKDALYKEYGYHTGIDIYADSVYSYASGVVTSVSRGTKYYAVTVQYNAFISLRYLHLKSVSVEQVSRYSRVSKSETQTNMFILNMLQRNKGILSGL